MTKLAKTALVLLALCVILEGVAINELADAIHTDTTLIMMHQQDILKLETQSLIQKFNGGTKK